MTMRQTLFALLQSGFLRAATPQDQKPPKFHPTGLVNVFVQGFRSSLVVEEPEVPPAPDPEPQAPKVVDHLFKALKPKFTPSSDLLLISEGDLESAKAFDTDNWLDSVSNRMIILSNDLKNVAIVRTGYSGSFF